MVRLMKDPESQQQLLELYESEMCEQLQVTAEQLREWHELIPAAGSAMHPERERQEAVYRFTRHQLETCEQCAKILKTGMTVKQVSELIIRDQKKLEAGKKSSFLEMYALLAEECPAGITAHAMRSYCTLFLYQNRGSRMLLSKDLARAAGIPEASAMRHIKYLQAVGVLSLGRNDQNAPCWDFSFVPKALNRYYPS